MSTTRSTLFCSGSERFSYQALNSSETSTSYAIDVIYHESDNRDLCLAKIPSACVFIAFQLARVGRSRRLLTVKISRRLFNFLAGWSFGEAQLLVPAKPMSQRKVIPGQKISQGTYSAFIPAPLPPAFDWTPRLIRSLSDADRLIGRLAGEGGRLPNPHVLIRPFVRREAVLSSRIEGTQATLGELLAAEAGAVVDRSPED